MLGFFRLLDSEACELVITRFCIFPISTEMRYSVFQIVLDAQKVLYVIVVFLEA